MIAAAIPPLSVLAAEPVAQPISLETALLIIVGLGLLWTAKSLTELHRRIDALSAAAGPKRPAAAAGRPAGAVAPEVLAVITAAVYESLGSEHRIVSINPEGQNPAWSMEGRRHIFSTRKVR